MRAMRVLPGAGRRVVRGAAAFAAFASLSAGVVAQPFPEPPAPGVPREAQIDAPGEARLPNGVRVIVASRADAALVTAQLFVLAGSEFDPPGRAGLATVTATLLTKGTRARSAPQLAEAAEALGGVLEPLAGWHQMGLGMTVARSRLDAALGLMAEALRAPAFAPAELERVRRQALDELQVAYAEPGKLAAAALPRLLFGDGAYGHPGAGTPASMARIRRDDLVALHRRVVQPGQAVLVLAGGLSLDAGVALAQRHLGGWTAGAPIAAAPAVAASTAKAPGALLIDLPKSGQAGVAVALRGVARNAPDYRAGQVANQVLGGGYSSRLNDEIRIRRGLSYGAGSRYDTRRAGGVIALSAQTKPESAVEVAGLLREALARMAREPVPAAELDARKATLIGGLSRSIETTEGLAARVGLLAAGDVPLDEFRGEIGAVARVSAADVQAFASRHWTLDGARVVVAGEGAKITEALRRAVPDLRVVSAVGFEPERLAVGGR